MTGGFILSGPAVWSQAALRIGYGLTLATHGWPKLLGMSHGSMADPMAGSVRLIGARGLPFGPEIAVGVVLLEAVGGLVLAVGLLTRPLALLFLAEAIGICFALGPTFAWIDRGIEYPLMLALIGLAIAAQGGGHPSLDRRGHRFPRFNQGE